MELHLLRRKDKIAVFVLPTRASIQSILYSRTRRTQQIIHGGSITTPRNITKRETNHFCMVGGGRLQGAKPDDHARIQAAAISDIINFNDQRINTHRMHWHISHLSYESQQPEYMPECGHFTYRKISRPAPDWDMQAVRKPRFAQGESEPGLLARFDEEFQANCGTQGQNNCVFAGKWSLSDLEYFDPDAREDFVLPWRPRHEAFDLNSNLKAWLRFICLS